MKRPENQNNRISYFDSTVVTIYICILSTYLVIFYGTIQLSSTVTIEVPLETNY